MATACGNRLAVNIKDLPVVTDINNGDFLIVETSLGTSIMDFRNFLITPENTTFIQLIRDLTTTTLTLSTDLITNVNTLSTLQDTQKVYLEAQIQAVSSLTVTDATFATISSNGTEFIVLKSNNINSFSNEPRSINNDGSIQLQYITNFADDNYCVSTSGYYKDDIAINLRVRDATTNSVTVIPISGTEALSGQPFTRGWVRITTI